MRAQGFHWTRREDHLPQAQEAILDVMRDVVSKAVLDIHGDAVAQAPVRTGLLKGSLQPILPDQTGKDIAGGVGTNVEYAAYVELGTGAAGASSTYPYPRSARYTMSWPGMRARAFLANAAKRVEPGLLAALAHIQSRLPGKV